jgi:Family of unknown function (DUF6084)
VPDLEFAVRGAEAIPGAAVPAIALHLEICNRPSAETIHSIALRCQIQIESSRRRYSAAEKDNLRDLFGEPERWGQTLRPMLWTNIAAMIPGFSGSTITDIAVPCTFDFNVSATKYLHGVQEGAVPVTLLFSGTAFYQAAADRVQASPISWNSEARFALPIHVWKDAMDLYYPNSAWLRLRRDVFERLYRFKVQQGLATFEEALDRMLEAVEVEA